MRGVPRGRRRIVPIIGGEVTGELDSRYAMQTHDGAVIEARNLGLRHGPKAVIESLARGEIVDASAVRLKIFEMTRCQFGVPSRA